jgi:hypothetical protein
MCYNYTNLDSVIIICSYDWWISNKSTHQSKPRLLVTDTRYSMLGAHWNPIILHNYPIPVLFQPSGGISRARSYCYVDHNYYLVNIQILMMYNSVVSDTILCSQVKNNLCFEEWAKQEISKQQVTRCLLPTLCWFLAWLTFSLWGWRRYVPLKRRMTYFGLHGFMAQKMEL